MITNLIIQNLFPTEKLELLCKTFFRLCHTWLDSRDWPLRGTRRIRHTCKRRIQAYREEPKLPVSVKKKKFDILLETRKAKTDCERSLILFFFSGERTYRTSKTNLIISRVRPYPDSFLLSILLSIGKYDVLLPFLPRHDRGINT